jgi:hypothetical protein
MYTLLRTARPLHLCLPEALSFAVSLLIAERLYHFHSFTLECLAFTATWFAFGSLLSLMSTKLVHRSQADHAR